MSNNYLILFVVVLAFATESWTCNAVVQSSDGTTVRGIDIVFDLDDQMFPAYWVAKPYSISATPIDENERTRSLNVIKTVLQKYPESLLCKNLKRVYFVRKLTFSGINAGGTYYKDRLYLANDGCAKGYTNAYLASSFHHEFSSVLFTKYKHKFKSKKWKSVNPKDFKYGHSGTQAIKDGKDSLHFNSKLAARGFINEYGQSSIEEDFNTIASRLFTADERFWNIYDQHERLQKKIDLTIDFYSTIDESLDKTFFKNLHK